MIFSKVTSFWKLEKTFKQVLEHVGHRAEVAVLIHWAAESSWSRSVWDRSSNRRKFHKKLGLWGYFLVLQMAETDLILHLSNQYVIVYIVVYIYTITYWLYRSKVAGKRDCGQWMVSAHLNVPFALLYVAVLMITKCDICSCFQASFVFSILGFGVGELSLTSV